MTNNRPGPRQSISLNNRSTSDCDSIGPPSLATLEFVKVVKAAWRRGPGTVSDGNGRLHRKAIDEESGTSGPPVGRPSFFPTSPCPRWKRSPFKWRLANDSPTLRGLRWLASRSQPASDGNFNPLIGVQLFYPCFFPSFRPPSFPCRSLSLSLSLSLPPSLYLYMLHPLFSALVLFLSRYKRKENFY